MKGRQKLRNALLIGSFLLFPVTQFYLSPYLIILGASKGIITGSFLVFTVMFLGALVVGRAFCGWLMPCGGLQEICTRINDDQPKTGKLDFLKFLIWVPWLLGIITAALLAGGYRRTDFLFMTDHGISVSNIYAYIIYYGAILIIFLNSVIFGKRATCHYICWMSPFMIVGRKISNLLNLPALRLKVEAAKCSGCKICNRQCPMSLDVHAMVQRQKLEHSECILCGQCADSCPRQAIKMVFGRMEKSNKRLMNSNIKGEL